MRLENQEYRQAVNCLKRYNYNCIKIMSIREDIMSISGLNIDRKSTRLNSSHVSISYAVFCLKKKKKKKKNNKKKKKKTYKLKHNNSTEIVNQ